MSATTATDEQLRHAAKTLTREDEHVEKAPRELESWSEVVHTADLALVLRGFVEEWRKRNGIDATSRGGFRPSGVLSPLQFLSQQTGKSERLSEILREKTEFVPLATADAILTAIERVEAFHTGECPIHVLGPEGAVLSGNAVPDSVPPTSRARPGFKRCEGELCRGRELPATPRYFYFHKSGRDAGRPRAHCKDCERLRLKVYLRWWRRRYPEKWKPAAERRNRMRRTRYAQDGPCGLVPVEKILFALDELVSVLGRAGMARRLGVSYHCLWAWLSRRRKNMHKEMAARVLRSLWEIRNDARVAVEHPVRSP